MKKVVLLLLLAVPMFGEEALGVPVPTGLQIYQTNMEGTAAGQYVTSAMSDNKTAFYFLVFWGKFAKDQLQEGMPENLGMTQLVFNVPHKNIDKVEFFITGKENTNLIFNKLELSNNAYKSSENEFDVLGLINVIGDDAVSYNGVSVAFYQRGRLLGRQDLNPQEIARLKKVMPFARSVLSAMMKEWMTAFTGMMKEGLKK